MNQKSEDRRQSSEVIPLTCNQARVLSPEERAARHGGGLLVPLPRSEWPSWTIAIRLAANSADAGIGDTVVRLIGPVTSEKFKTWYRLIFKKECGCERRQAEWNAKYPYTEKSGE